MYFTELSNYTRFLFFLTKCSQTHPLGSSQILMPLWFFFNFLIFTVTNQKFSLTNTKTILCKDALPPEIDGNSFVVGKTSFPYNTYVVAMFIVYKGLLPI